MPIIVNLDVQLAKRKMKLNELSEQVGISVQNLSVLKTGKARAIRFSTLDKLCRALGLHPRAIYSNTTKIGDQGCRSSRGSESACPSVPEP